MGSMIRPFMFAIGFVFQVGVMWWSYQQGIAKCEAVHSAEKLAQIEAGQKLEEERRKMASERAALTRKLVEEANATPIVVERCLGPDRVRRLQSIR